jgi:hypothetical protein
MPLSTFFTYCLRFDDGAAPNPYYGFCTLTICKPAIRRVAKPGERVEAVPEFGAVAVLREDPVAEAVDRGHCQLREVTRVSDLAGGRGQAVAHLEGGLLGESAQHELSGLRLLQDQEIQRPEDDAVRLAGARSRDHEQGAVEMADDLSLGLVERRVVLCDCGRDAHKSPPSES